MLIFAWFIFLLMKTIARGSPFPASKQHISNNLSHLENVQVFKRSSNYNSIEQNKNSDNQIKAFRPEQANQFNAETNNAIENALSPVSSPVSAPATAPSISINSPTLSLATYLVYVASAISDGSANPSNCNAVSSVASSTCNLRSAWALCDTIVASTLKLCTQSNGGQTGLATCTIALAPNSIHRLNKTFGTSLNLSYTPTLTSTSCQATFSIVNSAPGVPPVFNTSTYPVVKGDSAASNSFLDISTGSYINVFLQSLNINGFNRGALLFTSLSTVTIDDCHFVNNGYSKVSGSYGGAFLCNDCSQPSITYSSFTNNQLLSGASGGSVAILTSSTVTISNTVFIGNHAKLGGAVYCYDCLTVNVADSSFDSNSAGVHGAAIYYSGSDLYNSSLKVFELQNCQFDSNFASQDGGSVYIHIDGDNMHNLVSVLSSTFNNNTARLNGGAMAILSGSQNIQASIDKSYFYKNLAASDFGGAIYVYQVSTTIQNSIFVNNSAPGNGGGAVNLNAVNTGTISKCTLENNNAYFGGAIFGNRVINIEISYTTFISNSATYGGAVGNKVIRNSIVFNCHFSYNEASYGGAINEIGFPGDSTMTYTNNNFTSNFATFTGGAISASAFTSANVDRCIFKKNSAADGSGGAAHFQYILSGPTVTSTLFTGCSAFKGGAICLQSSINIFFDSCRFYENIAVSSGGAMYFDHFNSYIGIYNSKFTHNIATRGSGGALYFAGSNKYINIGGYLPSLQTIKNPDFVPVRNNQQMSQMSQSVPLSGDSFYVAIDSSTILDSKLGYLGAQFMSLQVSIQNISTTLNKTVSIPIINTNFSGVEVAGAYLQNILRTLPGFGTNLPMLIHGSLFSINYTDSSSKIVFQVFPFGRDSVLFKENSAHLFGGAIHWQKSNQYIFVMPNVKFDSNWVYQAGYTDDDSFISGHLKGTKLSDDDSHALIRNISSVEIDGFLQSFSGVNNSDQSSVFDDSVGGAISFYQSNTNINMFSVFFTNNIAGYGGAISLFLSNTYVNIHGCSFDSNKADQKDGAAIYLGTSNLNIAVVGSTFTRNVAGRNGGSYYLSSSNKVKITGCTFSSNSAGQDGGGMYLSLINILTIDSSTFQGNVASLDGGALYLDSGNSIVLEGGLNISDASVNIFDLNSASSGGAINLAVSNSIAVKGVNILSNNTASSDGSAIWGGERLLINMGQTSALYILNNNVLQGSALYLGPSCSLSESGVNTSIVFSGNSASNSHFSSAMYWVYDRISNASFSGTGTSFGSNGYTPVDWIGQAGTHIATQPVKLTMSLPTYTILNYQSEVLPPVYLTLEDYYGRSFRNDNSTIISVAILSSSCSSATNYSSGVAGLGGIQLKQFSEGIAVFENLTVSCYPGGSLILQFVVSLTEYQLDSSYNINSTSIIKFRRCRGGEIIADGKCCSDCGKVTSSSASASDSSSILSSPSFIAPVSIVTAIIALYVAYMIYRAMSGYFALLKLPTHRELRRNRFDDKVVLATIEAAPLLTLEKDMNGKSALEIAIDAHASDTIILALANIALPIDVATKSEHPGDKHKHAWTKLIQSDQYVHLLDSILSKNQGISELLCKIQDEKGRTAVDIATPLCAKCLKENTYFLKRFVFIDASYPEHESDTCVLHIVVDHLSLEKKKVALKFMSSGSMYQQELASRQKFNVDPLYVINIIDTFDATLPENNHLLDQFVRFGFTKYPYIIVMPAADRSLFNILSSENIAAKNWSVIKSIALDMATAINHIHEEGFIHGDLKPTNIMRMHGHILLIDLDASATIGESAGLKFSSGYVPPELLVEQAGIISFRPSIPASPSFDMWSFGVVLFELFSGVKLFETTGEGNVTDNDTLQLIKSFTTEFKRKKLNMIKDVVARNLVAQMLHVDASKRISAAKILSHSFFSKNIGVLKNGATYDVFISYRVASDSVHAQMVYDQLTAAGFKVYLDKLCIRAGHFWEEEFCNGLASSYIFLPLLSRGAINHATESRQCFPMLSASSPCDNVLLEYMLALELQMRGLIVNIYPVMIGDIKPGVDHLFGNYFKDGCHPSLGSDEVFVKNNQSALEGHLDRLGLGTPMLDDLSVSKTLKEITKNQGLFVEGSIRTCLQRLAAHVSDMRKDIDAMITNAAVEAKIQSEKDLNSRRRSSLLLTSILSTGVASSAGTSVLAALTTDTAKPSAPSPSLSPSPSPSQSPAPTSVPQVEVAFPDVYSIAVVPEQVTYEVNPSLQSKTTKPPKENNTTEGNMPEPVTENPPTTEIVRDK